MGMGYSCPMKDGEYLDQVRDYHLLKRDSAA
jgi:hypothetical protein